MLFDCGFTSTEEEDDEEEEGGNDEEFPALEKFSLLDLPNAFLLVCCCSNFPLPVLPKDFIDLSMISLLLVLNHQYIYAGVPEKGKMLVYGARV